MYFLRTVLSYIPIRTLAGDDKVTRRALRRKSDLAWDTLERRQLLSGAGQVMFATGHGDDSGSQFPARSASASVLRQDLARVKTAFSRTVVEVHQMQARSHVTRVEVQAVARDLAEWPHPTGTSIANILQFPDPDPAAFDLGIQIDYMYIDGSFSAQGWSTEKSEILEDLSALNWSVPESDIDQTLADMEILAHSAGVTRQEATNYLNNGLALTANLGPTDGVPRAYDPTIYLSTHLTGFIHADAR